MTLTLKIERFDPESDRGPGFREYTIETEESDRVLDLLMKVKMEQDGSLAFRKSCAHGVCGSDAMIINGRERLACKTLVRDVAKASGDVITIQPLKTLPVQRDLMVDETMFFTVYRSVKPFLINEEPVEEKERIQLPEERAKFDDATNCILCASCYSACPVIREGKNPAAVPTEGSPGIPPAGSWNFLGPAAIVQAARFLDDSRDRGFESRLDVLDSPNGVWPCENHFQCTVVCPRGIKVTKLINLTKRRIKGYRDSKT
jgi:succinate dehydrogenase / fumarate reductase iron-sulfur subunit